MNGMNIIIYTYCKPKGSLGDNNNTMRPGLIKNIKYYLYSNRIIVGLY